MVGLQKLREFWGKHWEVLTPLTAVGFALLLSIPLMLDPNPELTFQQINSPEFSMSILYNVIFIIAYPIVWIYFRGTDSSGYVRFKSDREGRIFILLGAVGIFLIIDLVYAGILPC